MSTPAIQAIRRSMSFHEAWKYAPTRAELIAWLDVDRDVARTRAEVTDALAALLASGELCEQGGRIGRPATIDAHLTQLATSDSLYPRKYRRAQLVTRWLSRLAGVRFVALANTTALGTARDASDLDFFVIARAGTIWSTRLLGGFPFKLLGWMPTAEEERDAVCLSYFIADDALDVSTHQLPSDDPYFRYWFLSLLPLFDDGVSRELWVQNASVRARHPFAEAWQVPPDLHVSSPRVRLPTRWLESFARRVQMRWFPSTIRAQMNNGTAVMVSDQVLKFHVTDARAEYRKRYETFLAS